MVDVRGDLLDVAEMHVLIVATVVAASLVHIWTIAPGCTHLPPTRRRAEPYCRECDHQNWPQWARFRRQFWPRLGGVGACRWDGMSSSDLARMIGPASGPDPARPPAGDRRHGLRKRLDGSALDMQRGLAARAQSHQPGHAAARPEARRASSARIAADGPSRSDCASRPVGCGRHHRMPQPQNIPARQRVGERAIVADLRGGVRPVDPLDQHLQVIEQRPGHRSTA